jgi:hypothetical protein
MNMYGEMQDDSGKAKVRAEIDQNLKRAYDDALQEEIPDRFKELLEKLRAATPAPRGDA